jgi:hypothetical protein
MMQHLQQHQSRLLLQTVQQLVIQQVQTGRQGTSPALDSQHLRLQWPHLRLMQPQQG